MTSLGIATWNINGLTPNNEEVELFVNHNKINIDFFYTLGDRFIIGGDWNSKNTLWGSRLTTTRDRELKKR
jgi:hypothetical protein